MGEGRWVGKQAPGIFWGKGGPWERVRVTNEGNLRERREANWVETPAGMSKLGEKKGLSRLRGTEVNLKKIGGGGQGGVCLVKGRYYTKRFITEGGGGKLGRWGNAGGLFFLGEAVVRTG